jgi:hypothetical protein
LHLKDHKITFPAVYYLYCFVKHNIYNSDETFYASVSVKEISLIGDSMPINQLVNYVVYFNFFICESYGYVEHILLEVSAASVSFYFTFSVNGDWINRTTHDNRGDPKYPNYDCISLALLKHHGNCPCFFCTLPMNVWLFVHALDPYTHPVISPVQQLAKTFQEGKAPLYNNQAINELKSCT